MSKNEIRQFRQALRLLEREISLRLTLEQSCCGVTLSQCNVLLELDTKGGIMLNELAAVTGLDKSTLSRTVDFLVNAGYVERIVPPNNRRSVLLSLSQKGKAESDAINKICDSYYKDVLESIDLEKRVDVIESVLSAGSAFEKVRLERRTCCRKN